MPNFISEDQIERALLQKLQHVRSNDGLDCHTEDRADLADGSRHANKHEVNVEDSLIFPSARTTPNELPSQ